MVVYSKIHNLLDLIAIRTLTLGSESKVSYVNFIRILSLFTLALEIYALKSSFGMQRFSVIIGDYEYIESDFHLTFGVSDPANSVIPSLP